MEPKLLTVDLVNKLERLELAAEELLADIERRYPGEELRCPYMRELKAAWEALT